MAKFNFYIMFGHLLGTLKTETRWESVESCLECLALCLHFYYTCLVSCPIQYREVESINIKSLRVGTMLYRQLTDGHFRCLVCQLDKVALAAGQICAKLRKRAFQPSDTTKTSSRAVEYKSKERLKNNFGNDDLLQTSAMGAITGFS